MKLSASNPKPDLHSINAHIKFGENQLTFTQVLSENENTDGQMYDRWMDGSTDRHKDD